MKIETPMAYTNAIGIFGLLFLVYLTTILPFAAQAAEMPGYIHLPPMEQSINKPVAVALDHSGRLYVAEPGTNRVVVLSQSGRFISTQPGIPEPISVAVDAAGRMYVGSNTKGNVAVYDAHFTLLFKLGSGDGEFIQPTISASMQPAGST